MVAREGRLRLRFVSEEELLEVRTIVAYESAVRGGTLAQTFCELVLGAVDVESYPPELRERLAEIDTAARERAAARSAEMLEEGLGGMGGSPAPGKEAGR